MLSQGFCGAEDGRDAADTQTPAESKSCVPTAPLPDASAPVPSLPQNGDPHPTAHLGQPLSCKRGAVAPATCPALTWRFTSSMLSATPLSVLFLLWFLRHFPRRHSRCFITCKSQISALWGLMGGSSPRPTRAFLCSGVTWAPWQLWDGRDAHLVGVVEQLQYCEDTGPNEQPHLPSDVTCRAERSRQRGSSLASSGRESRERAKLITAVTGACSWQRDALRCSRAVGTSRCLRNRADTRPPCWGMPAGCCHRATSTATNTHPASRPPRTPSSAQSSRSSGLRRRYPAPGCSPCAG